MDSVRRGYFTVRISCQAPYNRQAITSPYVSMSQSYMKQASQQWAVIYSIVRANCSVEFLDKTPQDDAMEYLLKAREKLTIKSQV